MTTQDLLEAIEKIQYRAERTESLSKQVEDETRADHLDNVLSMACEMRDQSERINRLACLIARRTRLLLAKKKEH